MKRVIMTGGGTSGHVTPNIALMPFLEDLGFEIHYLGTKDGIERKLIADQGIAYHVINAGKLRRYLSRENMTDIFKVMRGFGDAFSLIRRLKPDLVFSKGGFVASPVVWAAYLNKVPAVIHESDITPGLANKLSFPFATRICYTFPETAEYISPNRSILTGLPVRTTLLQGDPNRGRKICGFSRTKPSIVVIGGSQGSEVINNLIRKNLKDLIKEFQVCHICGFGGLDQSFDKYPGYKQFVYLKEELADIFAMADLVISRAGATTIFELLTLRKPNLLIPLSKKVSRGDQILNAQSFANQGFSHVLPEEIAEQSFLKMIRKTYQERKKLSSAMENGSVLNGIEKVLEVINDLQ